jgi:uncharacterized membrane protein YqiK
MPWTYLGMGAAAFVLLLIVFRLVWRVAEPNEALIISGLGAHSKVEQANETLGFKIVVGRGTSVLPGFQTVRRLPLDIRATPLTVTCVSSQGIPCTSRASRRTRSVTTTVRSRTRPGGSWSRATSR